MQRLETRLPIYLAIIVTCILGTYLFMTWTSVNGLSTILDFLYYQKSIKTFTEEIRIVINTTYYFALIIIFAKTVDLVHSWVYRLIAKDIHAVDFTEATQHAISTLFQSYIVFIAFFYHLLKNDGDHLHRHYINLLPFWFLSGTVVYILGSWLSKWAKLRLYWLGVTMSIILWILMAGEISDKGFIKKVLQI